MEENDPKLVYEENQDLDYHGSVFRYHGRAGQVVRKLKYQRCTGLAGFMAAAVNATVQSEGIDFDLVVAVPIHWYRRCSRGFNQAELIAKELPHQGNALRRIRATHPQAGLSTAQRLRNLDGAFQVTADVRGKSVLLIDDVVTSGQTARECSKALKESGAREVGVLAFCGEV
jgi:ComF family protein